MALNTIIGNNSIIDNTKDVVTLSNIKTLEEGIELYRIQKHLEAKTGIESYPIAINEDGSYITLAQMKSSDELSKLSEEVKYILLNLVGEKGSTNIPSIENIDYSKFYKLDASKLSISEKEAENLVIYIDGDNYKVINLAGVEYQKQDIYVIIPLNNEKDPEYITVANNTYKLYGNGTLKALGEKTVNAGYSSSEVSSINDSLDEFNIEETNSQFGNRMALPAKQIYFSTGTVYVIDQNNDLWAWGANEYNKLGLGHSYLVVEPTKILEGRCEQTKVSKVWAGITNTFVLDLNGNLWGCGTNGKGELGIGEGNTTEKYTKIDLSSTGMTGNDIEYISLSTEYRITTIIKFNNGQVFAMGANGNGQLGIGNRNDIYKITELTQFRDYKYIETETVTTLAIDNMNNLYICGGFYSSSGLQSITQPMLLKENVKQAQIVTSSIINGITTSGEYFTFNKLIEYTINGISQDTNAVFIDKHRILSNNEIYNIVGTNATKIWQNVENKEKYYSGEYHNGENRNMAVFQGNGKIYVFGTPNVTKIGEKSNYELRTVFSNAIFVNGNGGNISIVDRNGNVYESPIAESSLTNVKKIISSERQKYIITNDKHLYAKGQGDGSIWGEYTNRSEYAEIQKENGEIFDNVKNVFTSSIGNSVIIQTEDNKIYWGGNTGYISLPEIVGDYSNSSGNSITKYPKEVTSTVLEEIKDKIKDIQYFHDNTNLKNLFLCNVLILTEDGKLYTRSMNKVTSGNGTQVGRTTGDFSELIIKEGATVQQIATRDGLSLAILSNGEVYGWGYNTYGVLGASYEVGGIYSTPVKLEGLPSNIEYMSLGEGFAIFASKTGEVYGIGKNDYGQLGIGDGVGRSEFVRCPMLEE